MKINKKKNVNNKGKGLLFTKTRKQRRKEERQQKKLNRAIYLKQKQLNKKHGAVDAKPNANGKDKNNVSQNSNKIKELQAFVKSEKLKMNVKNKKTIENGEQKKGKNKKAKQNESKKTNTAQTEGQGFQPSSNTSERMARLQEYVEQEARKMGTFVEDNGKSKKKKKKQEVADIQMESGNKSNLNKDKAKSKKMESDISESDKEVKKYEKLLSLNKSSLKREMFRFGADMGSLLDDIETGNIKTDNYKIDEDYEDDFEKDMATALGHKKGKKTKDQKTANQNGGSLLDEDDEKYDEYEGLGEDDFDDFENGIEVESEEDGEMEMTFGEDSENTDDEEGYGEDEMIDGTRTREMDENVDSEDGLFSAEGEWSSDDGGQEDQPRIDFGRISREREEDFDGEEEEEDNSGFLDDKAEEDSDMESEDEREENNSFLDDEAMEGSDEESEDDGKELVHDIRKEEEYAFEGGSGYYSKPEILKNGQENDIDKYSSNSEDDTDLEDFVVDDDEVEFEDVDDELPEEESDDSDENMSDGLSPVKNRKKKRLVVESDEESENEESKKADIDSDEDADSDNNDESNKKTKLKLSTKSPRLIISDEDDSEDNDEQKENDEKKVKGKKQKNTKECKKFDSDSDASDSVDDVNLNGKPKIKLNTKSPRLIISDGDDDDESDISEEKDKKEEKDTEQKSIREQLVPLPIVTTEDSVTEDQSPLKIKKKKKKKGKKSKVKNENSEVTSEEEEEEATTAPVKKKKKKKLSQIPSSENEGDLEEDCTAEEKLPSKIKNKKKRKMDSLEEENEESLESNKRKSEATVEQGDEEAVHVKKKKKKNKPSSASEGSANEDSADSKIKTILKKPEAKKKKTTIKSGNEKAKAKEKRRVSFDLPDVTDEDEDEDDFYGDAKFSDDEEIEINGDGDSDDDDIEIDGDGDSDDESAGSAKFSSDDDNDDNKQGKVSKNKKKKKANELAGEENEDDLTEDIYGRLRDKDGKIVKREEEGSKDGKYVPPALRKLMALNTDEKKKEQLGRLKKSLKGLLNRLAESNARGIANQIEGMFTKYSRNDMCEILTSLLFESLVASSITPERLVQEHAMLVAILSGNIGEEVGAHILNEFVLKWSDTKNEMDLNSNIETKELDNMLQFIANLYNFKVVDATLIYGILEELTNTFQEKEVELILFVLRTVGFSLRKDNPLALKSLITRIQAKAVEAEAERDDDASYSRITFMLEVIQAIRNNHMAKVPNYDPTHVEHLKKVIKDIVRKGNQNAPLKVTLEDLLNSRECGRWWIVGSAFSGGLVEGKPLEKKSVLSNCDMAMEEKFSDNFKQRAVKLQLSRPPRINILYIVTEGSEDYVDAFDKLINLNLPPHQERELFTVILLCAQKGKEYNPFFAYLSTKMCKHHRKYVRLIQFALWDKFKEFEDYKQREIANMAKFISHLIGEDAINLSVLKTISFMEVEGKMVSFLRQLLISLLLHQSGASMVENIFLKLQLSPKLKMLRQSLRVFIAKFLSSKKNTEDENHKLLSKRIEIAVEILSRGGGVHL